MKPLAPFAYRGKLIYVEGVDGSGKTTLINKLIKLYSGTRNIKSYNLPNPDCKYYKEIRAILKSPIKESNILQNYMLENMIQLYQKIKPELAKGMDIIIDRSWISTLIYNTIENGDMIRQLYNAYEDSKTALDFNFPYDAISFEFILKYLLYDAPAPDACIFLDPPGQILEKNSDERIREGTAEENDSNKEKLYDVYRCYRNFFTELEETNRARITPDFRPDDEKDKSRNCIFFTNDIDMKIIHVDAWRNYRGYTKSDPKLQDYYKDIYDMAVYELDKLFEYLK